jgi:hypothetical protein
MGLVEQCTSFLSVIACVFSLSSPDLTKMYPFDLPMPSISLNLAPLKEEYLLKKVLVLLSEAKITYKYGMI